MNARSRLLALALTALVATGCATSNPLLVPARTLGNGRTAIELGAGYVAPVHAPVYTEALAPLARRSAGQNALAGDDAAIAQALAASFASTDGVAGSVGVRRGFGERAEAGVSLVGRTVRAGGRQMVWSTPFWALSVGGQARGAFVPFGIDGGVNGVKIPSAWLAGGDAIAILGRTSSGIYDLYFGLRAGYTYAAGTIERGAGMTASTGASAHRIDSALTVGLRFGFGRLSTTMEIEADAAGIWIGTDNAPVRFVPVVSLVPAASLAFTF